MQKLKERLVYLCIVTLMTNDVTARLLTSNHFYATNTFHIIDEPNEDAYENWGYTSWRTGETHIKPWRSGVYRSRSNAFYPSRNHEASSVTIEFEDSEIWLYRPPRRRLSTIMGEYEICLDKSYGIISETICYQVETNGDELAEEDYSTPAVTLAKDDSPHREDRAEKSLTDPTDSSDIKRSSATHTTEESTARLESPPTRCHPHTPQPPSSIRPSKSLPIHPSPRSAQRPIRRPVYRRPPNSRPFRIGSFTFWFYTVLAVFWAALALRAMSIQKRSKQRERERLLASIRAPRRTVGRMRTRVAPPANPSPLSSTQLLSYHTPPDDLAVSPSSETSDTFTIPPSYDDVIREQEEYF
ncbi:hypothetical protein ACGC1H_003205 [Rhizoctonia solani]|uniref:Uncharacterized protein n=1 Tax=Rhizoctonia solani TaxID=456999 RepID=A0A8H3GJE4_9AGAM|nr:unnamed protein product [Rhizoctonia solani]